MTAYIFVFRSKTDVFSFMEKLQSNLIPCQTIGTPREANIGCGLSVKVSESFYSQSRKVLFSYKFSSFYGVFKVKKDGERQSIGKIL